MLMNELFKRYCLLYETYSTFQEIKFGLEKNRELMMIITGVIEMSVTFTDNSPPQDSLSHTVDMIYSPN
mgnify:CR=1 FL=1